MSSSLALGNARLLQLAEILDTADERHIAAGEPTYDQTQFDQDCGSPGCAAGHWMAHNSDRWSLESCTLVSNPTGCIRTQLCDEFALQHDDFELLFGPRGCGQASTSKEASAYIRAFVARRSAS